MGIVQYYKIRYIIIILISDLIRERCDRGGEEPNMFSIKPFRCAKTRRFRKTNIESKTTQQIYKNSKVRNDEPKYTKKGIY